MNRMKKITAIIVALLLIILLPAEAHASTIAPRYTHIKGITARLEIDTTWGMASCSGELLAQDGMPVKLIVKLQKFINGQWGTIKTWSVEDLWGAYVNGVYAIDRGYDYRVYVVGYVYDSAGNILEIASMSNQQHY